MRALADSSASSTFAPARGSFAQGAGLSLAPVLAFSMTFFRFPPPSTSACLLTALCSIASGGCSDDGNESPEEPGTAGSGSSSGSNHQSTGGAPGTVGHPPTQSPLSGAYSWDDSWLPTSFPLPGMFDETHSELPPGKWGWDNDCDCPGDAGLALYQNEFLNRGLKFEPIESEKAELFGWRLVSTDSTPIEMDARLDNFEGSPGVDIIDLLQGGTLNSTGPGGGSAGINLGDGPDMLRFGKGWSVDLRTGDSERGAEADNDLVILGTNRVLATGEYDIRGATIHTGPGADLVFARNFGPAAIDLGNGQSGRTDTIDPADGSDMAILQGNMRDFRIYGGAGDDVFVWYVDEVDDDEWLGPNFFGGGGWGEAIWAEAGADRLILVIDPKTEIVSARAQHDNKPGSFLSFVYPDYGVAIDTPTEEDVFARYYGTVPTGPGGEHTVTVSYRSSSEAVFTHDFYLTSVEQIQMGVGNDAIVYDLNFQTGALTLSNVAPITEIPDREAYEELMETFPQ